MMATSQRHTITNSINVLHLNIRSLRPKLIELKLCLEEHKIDIFCLNETWLKPENNIEKHFKTYNIYRNDRLHSRGGGVLIGVKKPSIVG